MAQLAEALGADLEIRFVPRLDREFISALNDFVASGQDIPQTVEKQGDLVAATELYITTLSQG